MVFKANNSLVPHRRLDQTEIATLREQYGVKEQEVFIGAVGRLIHNKGWDTLIKAVKGLSKSRSIKLVLFGNGGLEEELKHLAKGDERIQFAGFVANIKDLYQAFDLAPCPSRFEPLPNT